MLQLLVNETTGGNKRIPFYLVDATDGITPETGVTPAASELQLSQNGGAFANFAGTWTEIGAGFYHYTPSNGEMNQTGYLALKFVKTGIRTFPALVQIVANNPYGAHQVTLQGGAIGSGTFAANAITGTAIDTTGIAKIADGVFDETMAGHTAAGTYGRRLGNWLEGTVLTDAGNTALTFKTNLTAVTTGALINCLVRFETGALAGQVQKCSAFNGTTDFITVAAAFTAAPANTDQFSIQNA
jgi:hypothetical protein